MTDISQVATAHTDGMNLCHLIGNGAKSWHRTERHTFVVHVKTGNDNTYTAIGKLITDINESHVKKLCLVNTDNIYVACQKKDRCRRVDRGGENMILVVTNNVGFRITHVDSRFEYFNSLFGKLRTSHSAYQFFCFAGEHRAAHYFNSSWAVCFAR